MKSIQRSFIQEQQRHPELSSYTNYANILAGKKYSKSAIRRWFNKLVDKDDYSQSDKRELYAHLYHM